MLVIARIEFVIVPLLLLLVGQSYSTANWIERYVIWTKTGTATEKQYYLQLCASKGQEKMCGNFTWSKQSCNSNSRRFPCFSKFICSTKNSSGGSLHNAMACMLVWISTYCQLQKEIVMT